MSDVIAHIARVAAGAHRPRCGHLLMIPTFFALVFILAGCAESGSAGSRNGEGRAGAPAGAPSHPFTDVTQEAGLGAFRHVNGGFGQSWTPEIVGAGGGFIDYDGDGWLDIILVGGGRFRGRNDPPVQALWLYRNNRDGTFTEVTREAGLADVQTYAFGIVAADYDNDGDQDLFVSTLYENLLFENVGGKFKDVSIESGVGGRSEWSASALFFDADRDGYLDLFVGNYVDWSPDNDKYCTHKGIKVYCPPHQYAGIESRFYHNNGDGTFTDRTEEAGFIPIPGKVFGVVELDYDNDGWPDLYIAEDTERDLLYHNNGDGTFTERGVMSGVAYDIHGKPRAGMGADAGVVDRTGEVTLFVGNFSHETVGVYRHLGNGLFEDRVAASRLAHPSMNTLTFGLILFDVDLDGDQDLLTANGHVQTHIEDLFDEVSFEQATQLYFNDGDGIFTEAAPEGVLAVRMVARGAAYGDYDRDGDLDVLLTENNGRAFLWRNDLEDGHFLRVHLEGVESNRGGLGARILVTVDTERMERRVRTGSSYLSQSEITAVFGLGSAERVDSLVVHWPSGHVDTFTEVGINQELIIREGDRSPAMRPITRSPSLASE